MDPIVAAFGSALVGAIATDAWEQVRDAFIGLWHRVHPQQEADRIATELDELRGWVLAARHDGDITVILRRRLKGPGSLSCSSCCEPSPLWPWSCGASWMRS
jgi:hypothetical protein